MSTKNQNHKTMTGLLKALGADEEFVQSFEKKHREEAISAHLQSMRARRNLTQELVAERLGVTQSAVSKLEHKENGTITLEELDSYLNAISETLTITFGKEPCIVDKIKRHAFHIRYLLDELADVADDDPAIREGVESFWREATNNIAFLLGRSKAVPHDIVGKMFREDHETEPPYQFISRVKESEEDASRLQLNK